MNRNGATEGFVQAGQVEYNGLNLVAPSIPAHRSRHAYGVGPFAKLKMPPLPAEPGVYLWEVNGTVVYVGQTRGTLRKRLGSMGYATVNALPIRQRVFVENDSALVDRQSV